jgi:hypothetical protein
MNLTVSTKYVCGIDLHAREMRICFMDRDGMKRGKHKNDPVDARDIADLLRTNRFPLAYDYPSEMRAVRDLLRRRHHFVRNVPVITTVNISACYKR